MLRRRREPITREMERQAGRRREVVGTVVVSTMLFRQPPTLT